MAVTISIRFLTGRAHLHHWQAHHSDGKMDWPPSPWRLLRALVAVAGRGLTSLPAWDDTPLPRQPPLVSMPTLISLSKRGVPKETQTKLSFSKPRRQLSLREPLSDDEASAWKRANPSLEFATAVQDLHRIASQPDAVAMADTAEDEIPLSRLGLLLASLLPVPEIWLPRSSHGHTRQYFPVHESGRVEPSGVPVFDTFAVVGKDIPVFFHWPLVNLAPSQEGDQREPDLIRILGRMTYFGRAESWCEAGYSCNMPREVREGRTHWRCLPHGPEQTRPDEARRSGRGGVDYTLERKLCPPSTLDGDLRNQFTRFLPSLIKNRRKREDFVNNLASDSAQKLLLRSLLRDSGEDIDAGLDRPIATRWICYKVPRPTFDVPARPRRIASRRRENIHLIRFALNTATTHRPVLPPLSDTLLVADKFRAAALAIHEKVVDRNNQGHPRNLCGREENGDLCRDHSHAFFWPTDDDSDGFIDHVTVWSRNGLEVSEADALRRLLRIRQRGGRPDLLVTPVFSGKVEEFTPWQGESRSFVSATPYFCPVHLSHGGKSGGQLRSAKREIMRSLHLQQLIADESEVEDIDELVFDYSPSELAAVRAAVAAGSTAEPVPPRQYFPVGDLPLQYPPLPRPNGLSDVRYRGAFLKDPDASPGYPFGLSIGLLVNNGTRFIRALSFCRRRRKVEVRGQGRMFRLKFRKGRSRAPFAIGAQCHFGLGLFVPEQTD